MSRKLVVYREVGHVRCIAHLEIRTPFDWWGA